MPAKKAATKKKKSSARTARGAAARRKPVAKKTGRKAARKKVAKAKTKAATKKATKKKKVARKSPAAKKRRATKKAAKKKVRAKKPGKKTAKKAANPSKSAAKRKSSRKKGPVTSRTSTKGRPVAKRATAARAKSRSTPAQSRSKANLLSGPIHGLKPYRRRRGEIYMSDGQLEHFRDLLNAWMRELMEEVDRTMLHMKDDAANFPDPNDRATQESEFGLELRTRDRERKLLKKIDSALQRIEDGSYGFCEETGDEIGLRRLEARPVATLCVEAQERRELAERQFRDREDYYR